MKIVCVQLAPELGQVQRNIDHATTLIAHLQPSDVDVLVLPEMAFTGYVFTSKDHIKPYLEDAETGPSVEWAKSQAQRLNAHVMVGYPERRQCQPTENNEQEEESKEEYYNSICFVSPSGILINTYAKHFLYYTDENWAKEGSGFHSIQVPDLVTTATTTTTTTTHQTTKVGFGICMDVNPKQFKADFRDFEFSNFHLLNQTDLILCSMAWNKGEEAPAKKSTDTKDEPKTTTKAVKEKSKSLQGKGNSGNDDNDDDDDDDDDEWEDAMEEEEEEDSEESEEAKKILEKLEARQKQMAAAQIQMETIEYWALRMSPFYRRPKTLSGGSVETKDAYMVVANRIGYETGALFVGSSCVLHLTDQGPKLLGMLPSDEEGVLQVEIDLA